MAGLVFICICVALAFVLAMYQAPIWGWAAASALLALSWTVGLFGEASLWGVLLWIPALIFGALSVPSLRRTWLIEPAFGQLKHVLPRVSDTEQQALDAGTVGSLAGRAADRAQR
jgi:acyl-CoA dehydrogenase